MHQACSALDHEGAGRGRGQGGIILEKLEIGYIGKIQKVQYLNKSFELFITLSSSSRKPSSCEQESFFLF